MVDCLSSDTDCTTLSIFCFTVTSHWPFDAGLSGNPPFLPLPPHSVSSRHSWPSGDVGVNLNRTAVTSGANTCSHSSLCSTRQTPHPKSRPRSPRRTLCSLEPDVTSDRSGSVYQLWDVLIPPRLPYKQKGRGCASPISSPTALLPLDGNCDTWESASVVFP